MSHVYKRRQKEYVDSLPSLFDYYAYMFHFTGLLGGPTIYYNEYQHVMKSTPSAFRWKEVIKTAIIGICGLILCQATNYICSLEDLLNPSLHRYPLSLRLAVFVFVMMGMRGRYYGLWKLGESMCILNGFGEENGSWKGISNVDILKFEFSNNYSTTARVWNRRIQRWLQMCIYERSNFNQFYVFMVSAFWHGFYPGYYIGFTLASFMTHVNRLATKKLWPQVQGTVLEMPYLLAGTICCLLTNTFMLGAHMCYTVKRTKQLWGNFDYSYPLFLVVACVVLTLMPMPKKSALHEKSE